MKKIIFVVAIVVVGIVAIYSTSKKTSELRVGLIAPLSGEYAVAGENFVKGVTLARDVYLREHPNSKIDLVVEDDGFDIKKGISAYKKLTGADNIDGLITVSTPLIDAIHEEMRMLDMPIMQLGIQTVGVAPDNIFQTSPDTKAGIIILAKYLNKNFSFKKTALVYDNTAVGLAFYEAFEEAYTNTHDDSVIGKRDDIRGAAIKIAGGNYDSVVILSSPENGALMTREILSLLKTKPQLIYDAQLQTGFDDYQRILGDMNVVDGAISFWFKEGNTEKFVTEFKNKYGEEPGFLADFGWDTFNVFAETQSDDSKKWTENIQKTKILGASGSFSFDLNGVREQEIVITTVKDGLVIPIK